MKSKSQTSQKNYIKQLEKAIEIKNEALKVINLRHRMDGKGNSHEITATQSLEAFLVKPEEL